MEVNPLYPGPKQAGPDGERLRLKNRYFFDESLKYCLNCKRCDVACPSGVKISDIIQEARIQFSTKKPKLRDRMLASTDFMGTMASPFAPIVNATLPLKPVKAVLDGVLGIDHRRTFRNEIRKLVQEECGCKTGGIQESDRLFPWLLCELQLSATGKGFRQSHECSRIWRKPA